MKIGVVESNGAQNYIKWQEMKNRLPAGNNCQDDTIYHLDDQFFGNSGGIFEMPKYYIEYLKKMNNIKDL